ncbi:Retrotransposable element Tf2 155 kDa protein type 3 [Rhizoctonia solani AG-1 IB]|uniref:Retrotransposable element Tf2 155 kDa protein type 3 n=1 Tax=Thanatephorus cucumeris (strain AG1-IB / isolate 7/3/14) TaxID=1108050 RepID=M5C8X9_THACB|nr:Retrotransposable element Tf2 155 kDa protein type 3 [Rhizoctonia solani AG-1 IB]
MGATNAVAEFQACMTFILQDKIPKVVGVFIHNMPIKGAKTQYKQGNGYKVLVKNPGIRCFIWEHAQDVHRILHWIGYAGAAVLAPKLQLAVSKVHLLGSVGMYQGRLPDQSKVSKIQNWPECQDTSEVQGFLGTCSVVQAWIRNYSAVAQPLTRLLKLDQPWQWELKEQDAMYLLKKLVSKAPCLAPLDCKTQLETTLAVDSSLIAVGFILYQPDKEGKQHPVRFGSVINKGK